MGSGSLKSSWQLMIPEDLLCNVKWLWQIQFLYTPHCFRATFAPNHETLWSLALWLRHCSPWGVVCFFLRALADPDWNRITWLPRGLRRLPWEFSKMKAGICTIQVFRPQIHTIWYGIHKWYLSILWAQWRHGYLSHLSTQPNFSLSSFQVSCLLVNHSTILKILLV